LAESADSPPPLPPHEASSAAAASARSIDAGLRLSKSIAIWNSFVDRRAVDLTSARWMIGETKRPDHGRVSIAARALRRVNPFFTPRARPSAVFSETVAFTFTSAR
jgi:hypothetical protein